MRTLKVQDLGSGAGPAVTVRFSRQEEIINTGAARERRRKQLKTEGCKQIDSEARGWPPLA